MVLVSLPTLALTADAATWTDRLSAWSALIAAVAALATVAVAVVAAAYAKKQVDGARAQLDEARTLRREQAQPYVVVYNEPSPASPWVMDIVIKNFGLTGAHSIGIDCRPPLRRTDGADGDEDVALPDLPFLAPGQEWRTFWDSGIQRHESELPKRYDLDVTYADRDGELLTTPSVLDWSPFEARMFTEEKTIGDIAKTLEKIEKTLQEHHRSNKVIKIATYDGKIYDQEQAKAQEERRQRNQELTRRLAEAAEAAAQSDGQRPPDREAE